MGYWWHYHTDGQSDQYLQLENGRLCFKVAVSKKEDQKRLRSEWHRRIIVAGSESQLKVVKPKRFGLGKCMTVAELVEDYRAVDKKEVIDVDATIATLRVAETIMDRAIGNV